MTDEIRDALDNFYAQQAEITPRGKGPCSLSYTKPQESLALQVRPKQVKAAKEWAKRMGVPTEFTPQGSPVLTSRAHAKAYHKIRGVFNRDGGYGDCTDVSRERSQINQIGFGPQDY